MQWTSTRHSRTRGDLTPFKEIRMLLHINWSVVSLCDRFYGRNYEFVDIVSDSIVYSLSMPYDMRACNRGHPTANTTPMRCEGMDCVETFYLCIRISLLRVLIFNANVKGLYIYVCRLWFKVSRSLPQCSLGPIHLVSFGCDNNIPKDSLAIYDAKPGIALGIDLTSKHAISDS